MLGLCLPGLCRAELLIAGAVSLRTPLETIAVGFEAEHPDTRVRLTFGASSALSAQARAGAPIDVFVSAAPRWVDRLAAEDWVAAQRVVAHNRLVVVHASDVALVALDALAAPTVRRVAVPSEAVPLGGYARAWLARRELLAPLRARIVQTEHARATLAAVDAGNADAAIVYATDARIDAPRRGRLDIPDAEQPQIDYVAAVRRRAAPGADDFFAYLASPTARRALEGAGFLLP